MSEEIRLSGDEEYVAFPEGTLRRLKAPLPEGLGSVLVVFEPDVSIDELPRILRGLADDLESR